MNDRSSTDHQSRRLEYRLEKLNEQLKDLANDNRDLHRQMAAVVDQLSGTSPRTGDAQGPELKLPPPSPSQGLMTRIIRKGLREVAGVVRTLRRATDPGADMVRSLFAVAAHTLTTDLPALGDEIVSELPEGFDPGSVLGPELSLLFALEGIDAAWVRVPGLENEVLVARRDLHQHLCGKGWAGLARAAHDLGRPVIAKRLPCPSVSDSNRWILHPVHHSDGSKVWRTGPYLVGLPRGVRRAELQLNSTACPDLPRSPADLLVVISEPLVEGLERRVSIGLEASGEVRSVVVSLAPWTEAGHRRLTALASVDQPVYDFGSILHPATWMVAVRSLLRSTQPTTMWAVGTGTILDPMVSEARQTVPTIHIVGEAVDAGSGPRAVDSTIARTKAQRGRLAGTPGIGALHMAPTPLATGGHRGSPGIRRILGVPADATLVVVAGDLTDSSRAEDAAAVARHLSESKDVWFRVVGRGPLAPAVADLGRLFGLERFSVSDPDHSLEEVVAAADIVCCPGRCEVLPPAAAIAVTSGIPVVAPSSGELTDLAEIGAERVFLAGSVGDSESLASAILEAIAEEVPRSTLSEEEIGQRADQTSRIYRKALAEKS